MGRLKLFDWIRGEGGLAPWKSDYTGSDYGRKYGWWVYLEDDRVGVLDYRVWDWDSQFWHLYRFSSLCGDFDQLRLEGDIWASEEISLMSRYSPEFMTRGCLISERQEGLVAVRSALIPEEVFREAHQKYSALVSEGVAQS